MLNTQKTLLACLWSVLAVSVSMAAGFGPADAYTWGIDNTSLGIVSGSAITGAKLTIHNAAFDPASTIKSAAIRLLNNPEVGMTTYADGQAGDFFAPSGALVAELKTGSLGTSPQNVVIDLAAKNDPAAAIWKNFGQPFEITLANSSKVSYSSAMLALLDYAGSGRSFGFGVNCDGLTFTNLSLELTVASMTVAAPVQTLRFSASSAANTPPVLAAIADQTVSVGQALQFTISATDADGDALAYTAAPLPTGATFVNRVFSWTPAAGQEGTHQVTFTVTDGSASDSAIATFTVTSGSSSAEIIIDNRDSAVEMVGTWPLSGGVNPYGTDAVYNRDAGNSFSWLFTAPETGSYQVSMWWTEFSSRSSVTPVDIEYAGGAESLAVDQLTNGGQWNILGVYPYQAGTTYRVSVLTLADRSSICADAVRFVKTDEPSANNPPVLAAIDSKSVQAGTLLTITPSASDPDGDTVIISAQNLPSGAAFNGGVFSWTPTAAQVGTYNVTFNAADGKGGTDSITVQITVQAASSQWVQLANDNFESGWGNYAAGIDGLLYRNTKYAHQGTSAANIQSTSGSFALARGLDVSRYSEMKIEFWYIPVSMDVSGDTFRLDYWNGSQWVRLKRWAYLRDFANFNFYFETVTISKSAYPFPANMKIRFVCEATDKVDDIMIDEIVISAR